MRGARQYGALLRWLPLVSVSLPCLLGCCAGGEALPEAAPLSEVGLRGLGARAGLCSVVVFASHHVLLCGHAGRRAVGRPSVHSVRVCVCLIARDDLTRVRPVGCTRVLLRNLTHPGVPLKSTNALPPPPRTPSQARAAMMAAYLSVGLFSCGVPGRVFVRERTLRGVIIGFGCLCVRSLNKHATSDTCASTLAHDLP